MKDQCNWKGPTHFGYYLLNYFSFRWTIVFGWSVRFALSGFYHGDVLNFFLTQERIRSLEMQFVEVNSLISTLRTGLKAPVTSFEYQRAWNLF